MWPAILLTPLMQAAGPVQSPVKQSPPTVYEILKAEQQRAAGVPLLRQALAAEDTIAHRYAVRAIGRLRDSSLAPLLAKAMASPAKSVQVEAARAAGLIGAEAILFANGPLSGIEDAELRAVSYESYGRVSAASESSERVLLSGLHDSSAIVRRGAGRGIEVYLRRSARRMKPSDSVLSAISTAFQKETDSENRTLLLLALNTASHRDSAVIKSAIRDRNAEVRRLGVMLGREWIENDPSPQVRYQMLKVAGTCERAITLSKDKSEHVALAAIDMLGEKKCDTGLLVQLAKQNTTEGNWRSVAHATAALARATSVDASDVRSAIAKLATSGVWQARAWAAEAARLARDSGTLARLASDANANVVAAAITTSQQALQVLNRDHAGLLFRAANILRQDQQHLATELQAAVTDSLRKAFDRVTSTQAVTWRDARVALLRAVAPPAQASQREAYISWLTQRLDDIDPVVASLAHEKLAQVGRELPARTLTYSPPAFVSELTLASLQGATATIHFRNKGNVIIKLMPEMAPATVSTFVTLADSGAYNGKTIHRVVPNFVLQGGSPGADEYDPLTSFFMRDEVGGSHKRGTLGISTRGPDTGDGQIFFNLVDNVRLDSDYTVFADIISGLDIMDSIGEGDIIESIKVQRVRMKPTGKKRTPKRGKY